MKVWTFVAASIFLSTAFEVTQGCSHVRAEATVNSAAAMKVDMSNADSNNETAPTARGAATLQAGQAAFAIIKQLVGKWEAPMGDGRTIIDTFQPFALGTAILAEEWVDGQQITSTVFYMVGPELRADHYCDYLNQPRYVAQPSADPSIVDFAFREATNLDAHPTHFHATRWQLIDATHLTQDWDVEGGAKGNHTMHLNFVRQPVTTSLSSALPLRIYLGMLALERNANAVVKRALATLTDRNVFARPNSRIRQFRSGSGET